MVIKKFQAPTEAEAILKAKEELGSDAVVLNEKTIKHRGLAKLFKQDYVEITAALEEKVYVTGDIPQKAISDAVKANMAKNNSSDILYEEGQKTSAIEEKLDNLQLLLESKIKDEIEDFREEEREERQKRSAEEDERQQIIKLIYNQMIKNEVDEKIGRAHV